MGIEEDIAASEQLIWGIVAEHDLDHKSPDEIRGILREFLEVNPRDMPKRDKVAISVLRVYLERHETGKNYSEGNGEGD